MKSIYLVILCSLGLLMASGCRLEIAQNDSGITDSVELGPEVPQSIELAKLPDDVAKLPSVTYVLSQTTSDAEVRMTRISDGVEIFNWTHHISGDEIVGLSLQPGTEYKLEFRGKNRKGSVSKTTAEISFTLDPCLGTVDIGTTCQDGSIYLGEFNGFKYFTTGGGCNDSPTPVCNGSTDYVTKIWGEQGLALGVPSTTDGPGNTALIVATKHPYIAPTAAEYCNDMDLGLRTDWFLPAKEELNLLWLAVQGGHAISGLNVAGGGYRASTERGFSFVANQEFVTGTQNDWDFRENAGLVRCMRRVTLDFVGPNAPANLTVGAIPFSITKTPIFTYTDAIDVGGNRTAKHELRILKTSDQSVVRDWADSVSGARLYLSLASNTEYTVQVRALDEIGNIGAIASANWTTATLPGVGDPCLNDPDAGTICADGMIYLGIYNGFKYRTTRGGCSEDGTTCSGGLDSVVRPYANGTGGDILDTRNNVPPFFPAQDANFNSSSNGANNTLSLAQKSDTFAAKYCDDMNYGGKTDWFLPASGELNLLWEAVGNGYPIEGLFNVRWYWSSTATSYMVAAALVQNFIAGAASPMPIEANTWVRCMRKDAI